MTDVLTPEQRRFNMSRIRNKDTRPEIVVRSLVHQMGYRYRLHNSVLPGKPDIVLSRLRKIILVHGCFWHMHRCPHGRVKPKTRASFWQNKRMENMERDKRILVALRRRGWQVLVVWECWTRDLEALKKRLVAFLRK
jgi:DNA mismatch endonuclease (patch repair protein)